MIIFIFYIILLSTVAISFIIPPLLSENSNTGIDRKKYHLAFYQQRQIELGKELQGGLIDQDEFDNRLLIYKKQLADEISPGITAGISKANSSRWLAVIIATLIPVAANAIYLPLGGGKAALVWDIPDEDELALMTNKILPPPEAINARSGLDAVQWHTLGQTYFSQERYRDAAEAYHLALQADPRNADYLVDYAEALIMGHDREINTDISRLLEQALSINPDQPRALWLMAVAASRKDEREKQTHYLKRLLTQLPDGVPEAVKIREVLTNLEENYISPETSPEAAIINVNITIDPVLKKFTHQDDTVFIYARALEGLRTPLAISRYRLADLPATITLNDSLAMTPAMKLSAFNEVEVLARISKSGKAQLNSGDLVGRTGPVATDTAASVSITIDQQIQ